LTGAAWEAVPAFTLHIEVTVLEGPRKKLGNARVRYPPLPDPAFEPIDDRYLSSSEGQFGIAANYTNDGSSAPAITRIESR
jgi:hypothetical protein